MLPPMWQQQRQFTSWGFFPFQTDVSSPCHRDATGCCLPTPKAALSFPSSLCSPQVASLLPPSQVFVTQQTARPETSPAGTTGFWSSTINPVTSLVEMSGKSQAQLARAAPRTDPTRRDTPGVGSIGALALVRSGFASLRIQSSGYPTGFPL